MKQPIALIITDTHLKEDNIDTVKSIFRQAISLAKELGLTQIEHAGDIFNSRKAQTQVTLDALDEIFSEVHKEGITLNIVIGNHDKTEYSSPISFVKHFRHFPGVNIYSKSGGRQLVNGIILYYLSYFSEDVYIKELEDVVLNTDPDPSIKNILLTHIDVAGGVMNNGIVVQNKITPDLFNQFDLTLIGHWHDQQIMNGGKIIFMGASLQHNFGELLDKGATILYDDLSTETIPFKYPQYIKYEISPKDLTDKDIADLRKEKLESGDNIRVVLVGSDADIKSFNKQILIDAGVSVEKKQDEIDREELEHRVEPFDILSLSQEFDEYCEKNKLNKAEGARYFEQLLSV